MSWYMVSIIIASGLLLGYLTERAVRTYRVNRAQQKAEEILEEARQKDPLSSEEIEELNREIEEFREELENEIHSIQDHIEQREERIQSLHERLDGRRSLVQNNREQIDDLQQKIEKLEDEHQQYRDQQLRRLEEESGVDRTQILQSLTDQMISEAELSAQDMVKRYENSTEAVREKRARHVVDCVISRCDITSPHTIPSPVLKFPDEDAYERTKKFWEEHEEQLLEELESGVRFDDENQLAVVETLEPVKKEIVHRTLNNIIQQKKFRYELVQKGLERYRSRVENEKNRSAREAVQDCSVGRIPDRIFDMLGTLRFRTSYGQQQLIHSREVSHLASLMAEEIGANAELARRAGLLHDIGKAIDRQRDSGHAVIGAEVAEEENEHPVVVNAIGSHHGDMEATSVESFIVAAADAISGSRPGARRENVTNYSERIEALLELAKNRKGIKKVYAMNAGRELRVRVNRDVIKDTDMEKLARAIARDIEEELTYSGEIKINTIRETKIVRNATN